MKKFFYKLTAIIIAVIMLLPVCLKVFGEENDPVSPPNLLGVPDGSLNLNCKSAILMEATTGSILYLQNSDQPLPPASVTKIMTMLLVAEAINSKKITLADKVACSAKSKRQGLRSFPNGSTREDKPCSPGPPTQNAKCFPACAVRRRKRASRSQWETRAEAERCPERIKVDETAKSVSFKETVKALSGNRNNIRRRNNHNIH